jgi:RNA polymerase-binding transcription factor DksA
MRATDKLTRDERREIEALLIGEMERLERSPGLFEGANQDAEFSGWSNTPVSDSSGTPSPSAILQSAGRYQALSNALQRLHDGTYGHCVYCRNLIPAGRLLVIPETEHCRKCGRFS